MLAATITPYELLERSCRRHAERIALRCGGRELSYGDLRRQALAFAGALARSGLGTGTRVVLLLRNSIEYAVADLGILALGAVKVPLNELLSAADVAHALEHAEAQAVVAHTSLAPVLEQALAATRIRPRLIAVENGAPRPSGWDDFAVLVAGAELVPGPVDPAAPALILYTGGTTGRPKGVLHTRDALGLNLLSHVIAGEVRPGEAMLLSTPLPHSAGFHMQACLAQGGTVTLLPRFDVDDVLATIARERIGWTFLVPTMLYRLLDAPALATSDTSSLRTVVYGAAPIDPARLGQALERFGAVFLQLYGQVECPNFVTTLAKSDHLRPELQTSCGQPVSMCEVRIVGDDGAPCAAGVVGELTIRSPYLLREYYRAPELTAAARPDGWQRTGDLAYQLASGHVFLVDRAKDMIISGGMNVYSREVEDVLQSHPAVAAAAVFGVPHADWGEAVHAVVVGRGAPQADDILEFCRSRVAAYKLPKAITFATELPLTAYGKVDKKRLREPFWAGHERAIH